MLEMSRTGHYINTRGEVVIVTAFNHEHFSRNLASIGTNGNAGFIDKTGRIVIPPRFDSVRGFHR
ncbi:MAG: hypothetical protein DMG90_09545 [Acidobacteria bacterium]|nr:MAG: hypothetical protein DMG90_09545 [Acidobacteriota bacterium]